MKPTTVRNQHVLSDFHMVFYLPFIMIRELWNNPSSLGLDYSKEKPLCKEILSGHRTSL